MWYMASNKTNIRNFTTGINYTITNTNGGKKVNRISLNCLNRENNWIRQTSFNISSHERIVQFFTLDTYDTYEFFFFFYFARVLIKSDCPNKIFFFAKHVSDVGQGKGFKKKIMNIYEPSDSWCWAKRL